MANDVAVSSFSSYWHPKALAQALALSQPEREDAPATYLSQEDNDWAASFLLIELLLNATPRRASLNRERASELLRVENSEVSVEQLEARGFLRFVLGRLQIPQAVRMELRVGQHVDQLPEVERTALKHLDQARQDKTALLWVTKDDVERIHFAHNQAHRRTPSLEALHDMRVLAPAKRGDVEGYDLLLNDRQSPLWGSYLGSRVLGLYWERLVQDKPIESDDEQFVRWLNVALEEGHWTLAPRWMRVSQDRKGNFRARLIDAAARCILEETDLLDGQKELTRIRWEHNGFGFCGAPDLPPLPGHDESLRLLYEWWRYGQFESTLGHCRGQLDGLISLVVHYDRDPWALRVVQLLKASRERPYLMYSVGIGLLWGSREAIAGLVANLETASVGMRLLSELTVAEDTPVPAQGIDRGDREAKKTRIWREAVAVLLGMLHVEVQEGQVQTAARALAEILVIAAKSVYQRSHLQVEEDCRRRGSEARLEVLLGEVQRTGDHILFKMASEFHRSLNEQACNRLDCRGSEAMPVAEMKVLFWLLRTVLSAQKTAALDPTNIAETLLDLYRRELRREVTADGSTVVSWVNDAPAALSLPWLDLAAFLQRQNLAQQLVGPEGVDFDACLRNVPIVAQTFAIEKNTAVEHQLSRAWIQKTRTHVRILMCIHEAARESVFDPVLGLTNNQRVGLLALVERSLRKIVQTFAAARRSSARESLFASDSDYRPDGVHSLPGLLRPLVRTFNRFSGEVRNRAFADWLEAEDAPDVLLTVLDEALPIEAKQWAASRLKNVDIDQFLVEQMWATRIEQVAEAAALLPDQTAIVEKILAYGDSVVKSGYKREWASFAYRMRLMVAYHKKDLAGLERVAAPDDQRINVDGQWLDPAEDTRNFYCALLLIEDQPEQARRIFDDLLRKRPGSASDALNRFSASVRWAGRIEEPDERRREFLRALREWEEVAPSIPTTALVNIRTKIAYLRLASFDGAKQYGDFDAEWSRLDAAQRAQIEFVTLAVENARSRDLRDQVEKILKHARPYHTNHDAEVEERFAQIEKDVEAGKVVAMAHAPVAPTPGDNIEARRRIYQELPRIGAEEAVRVVGQGDDQLHDYLAERLLEVAAEFLDRSALFARFKDEDQYNDVMVSFLKMRLKFLGWHVADQTRGGYSETGKDAGERDWVIRDGRIDCAIFEALRLRSLEKDEIDKHVEKAISGYNKIGVPRVYIVVYYEGPSWSEFWAKYWGYVQSKSVNGSPPIQKTDALAVAASAKNLRMGQVVYDDGNGILFYVYHLAMNLNGT